MARIATVCAAVCLLVGLSGAVVVSTPDQTVSATPGDSAALLAEVRRLREAIEALAGTGARVQIVFGRLQLQEQRTAAADRRLDNLRGALAVAADRVSDLAERMKEIEAMIAAGQLSDEQRTAYGHELTQSKRELNRFEIERSRLASEEAEAASLLALEQNRWSDLNRQLDELEKQLTVRRQ